MFKFCSTFSLALLFTVFTAYGQLKVFSTGDISLITTNSTPRSFLDINQTSPNKPHLTFGNLTLQSLYDNNALFGNNMYNGPGGLTAWNAGEISFFHWVGPYTFIRSARNLTAGQTVPSADLQNNLVANHYGYVGINMPSAGPSAAYPLHVTGNAGKTSGGTDWIAISDSRLKKNVKPFEDGLKVLLQLNPVFFEYTGEAGTTAGEEYVGLIAQEMQKIAPYTLRSYKPSSVKLVDGKMVAKKNPVDEYLSLDNTAVRYILVNAVKEQQKIIQVQNKRLAKLEEIVASLQGK